MISIHDWRYESARQPMLQYMPKGWYCNVYPDISFDNPNIWLPHDVALDVWMSEFENWMAENCPTSIWNARFNSGHTMYSVYITDINEASIFRLRWS